MAVAMDLARASHQSLLMKLLVEKPDQKPPCCKKVMQFFLRISGGIVSVASNLYWRQMTIDGAWGNKVLGNTSFVLASVPSLALTNRMAWEIFDWMIGFETETQKKISNKEKKCFKDTLLKIISTIIGIFGNAPNGFAVGPDEGVIGVSVVWIANLPITIVSCQRTFDKGCYVEKTEAGKKLAAYRKKLCSLLEKGYLNFLKMDMDQKLERMENMKNLAEEDPDELLCQMMGDIDEQQPLIQGASIREGEKSKAQKICEVIACSSGAIAAVGQQVVFGSLTYSATKDLTGSSIAAAVNTTMVVGSSITLNGEMVIKMALDICRGIFDFCSGRHVANLSAQLRPKTAAGWKGSLVICCMFLIFSLLQTANEAFDGFPCEELFREVFGWLLCYSMGLFTLKPSLEFTDNFLEWWIEKTGTDEESELIEYARQWSLYIIYCQKTSAEDLAEFFLDMREDNLQRLGDPEEIRRLSEQFLASTQSTVEEGEEAAEQT